MATRDDSDPGGAATVAVRDAPRGGIPHFLDGGEAGGQLFGGEGFEVSAHVDLHKVAVSLDRDLSYAN